VQTLPLDILYLLGALVVGPFYLLSRLLRRKRLASPWRRLGFVDRLPRGEGPVIWIHAVSVGESLAIRSLVGELQRSVEGAIPVITCTTATGLEVARKTYPGLHVLESPYDLGCAIRRFLSRVRPDLLVLVEVELWPNQLAIHRRRRIPVVVVNGKLSEESTRGYRRLQRIMPGFLKGISAFLMQNELYGSRLETLGVPRERIEVVGNLKFDNARTRDPSEVRQRLRSEHGFGEGAAILLAGSTHKGEEDTLLQAAARIRADLPGFRLVLAPRHPERVSEVLEAAGATGWTCGVRSRPQEPRNPAVLVIDTMGELSTLYGLADLAFVGGTLAPVGGHNLLEPAELGLPILVGPHLHTVRETADALQAGGALQVVRSAEELACSVLEFLRNQEKVKRAADAAHAVIEAHRGSVGRTLEVISRELAAAATRSNRNV
jgi:3-deoxy-D-manno-octulosonic-acid transferase